MGGREKEPLFSGAVVRLDWSTVSALLVFFNGQSEYAFLPTSSPIVSAGVPTAVAVSNSTTSTSPPPTARTGDHTAATRTITMVAAPNPA